MVKKNGLSVDDMVKKKRSPRPRLQCCRLAKVKLLGRTYLFKQRDQRLSSVARNEGR